MESNTLYIISKEELKYLLARDMELMQLEQAGVDNWPWYGEGRKEYIQGVANDLGFKKEEMEDLDFEDLAEEMLIQNYEELV